MSQNTSIYSNRTVKYLELWYTTLIEQSYANKHIDVHFVKNSFLQFNHIYIIIYATITFKILIVTHHANFCVAEKLHTGIGTKSTNIIIQ